MTGAEPVKETLKDTFNSILDEIFEGNSKLCALQKYIDSPGTQAADATPALDLIGAIKVAKLRNQKSGLLVNFSTGLVINIAGIIGGTEAAKKVSDAANDGCPRLIQLYTASAAGVTIEAWDLRKHEDFLKLTAEQLPTSFVSQLFQQGNDITKYLRANLSVDFSTDFSKTHDLTAYGQVATGLNELCAQQLIYQESRFRNITLPPRLTKLVKSTLPIQQYSEVNRLLMEAAFPRDFTRRKLLSNFFERHPDLRSEIIVSKPYSWLAENKIETYEAMCQKVGMSSPNEVTVIGAEKAVMRDYNKLNPSERPKFAKELWKGLPELKSAVSSTEIVSMTRAAFENGSDTDRQKMKNEILNIVGHPMGKQVANVDFIPTAGHSNALSETEREEILAPSSVPDLNWEELVARARKLIEQCPESERARKCNLIKPFADLINPIDLALTQSSQLANALSAVTVEERDKLLAQILPQISGKTTMDIWLSNAHELFKSVEKDKKLLMLESVTGLLTYGEAKEVLPILTKQLLKTLNILSDGERKHEVEELRKTLNKPSSGELKTNAKQIMEDDLTPLLKF